MRLVLGRGEWRWNSLVAVLLLTLGASSRAWAEPPAESLAPWGRYVDATEARRAKEASDAGRFLALDFTGDGAHERRAVLHGDVVIARGSTGDVTASTEIPSALVHHWRGAVFVRGVTVAQLLARLEEGPPPQRDVLAASIVHRSENRMSVHLRVRRTKLLTVVYDTEHDVRFARRDATTAASVTKATRIVEVAEPGTPRERLLGPDEDRGFLWRLHAYWRYQEAAGGVIAECETISLSRRVPFGLGALLAPLIEGAARESIDAALRAVAALGVSEKPPATHRSV